MTGALNPSRLTITATISLAIGIITAKCYSVAIFISITILIISFILFITLLYYRKRLAAFAFLMVIIACTGAVIYKYKADEMIGKKIQLSKGTTVNIRAIVTEPPVFRRDRPEFIVRIIGIDNETFLERKDIRAIIKSSGKSTNNEESLQIKPGSIISFSAKYSPPDRASNPWQFDYGSYLELNGISYIFRIQDLSRIKVEGCNSINLLINAAFFARQHTSAVINNAIPYPESALMAGIVLGTSSELPDAMLEDFRTSGVVHILAASGFNISVVIAFFVVFLNLIGVKKNYIFLLPIPAVILYSLMAGGSPSIVRAAFMGVFFLFATAFNREYNPLQSLFIAGFIMLLWNPFILFLAGFQLSFAVTCGILMLFPVLMDLFPKETAVQQVLKKRLHPSISKISAGVYQFVLSALLVAIAAQVSVIPFLSVYFNRISLVNIAANVIVTPVASISLPVGFAGSLAGLVFPHIGREIVALMYFPLKYSSVVINWMSSFKYASFPVPSAGLPFIVLYSLVFLVYSVKNNFISQYRIHITFIAAVAASFLLVTGAIKAERESSLTVFNTSGNHFFLLRHGRQNIMTVIAKKGKISNSEFEISSGVMPALRSSGFPRLLALVVLGEEGARLPALDTIFDNCSPQVVFVDSVFSKDPRLPAFILQAEKNSVMVYQGDYNYNVQYENSSIDLCFNRKAEKPSAILQCGRSRILAFTGSFIKNSLSSRKVRINSGDVLILADPDTYDQVVLAQKAASVPHTLVILLSEAKSLKNSEGNQWYKKKFLSDTLNETGKLLTPSKDGSVILDLSGPIPRKVLQQK